MPLLADERALHLLADAINAARETWRFTVWAYVFMSEHVHILLHPSGPRYDIGLIRKAIKQPVASRYIRRLRETASPALTKLCWQSRDGRIRYRFWQKGPGFDRNLFSPKAIHACIAYIHANPARRGLVEVETDWKWSSANFYHAGKPGHLAIDPCPVLGLPERGHL